MQDLHLFKNLVSNNGENAFTEALAATLKASASFLEDFLDHVGCSDRSCKIETQPVYPEGRPDLQISSSKTFLLMEVKWGEPLLFDQLENYQCILDKVDAPFKLLVALTTPSTKIDESILSQPRTKLLKWPDIYQIAQCSLVREKDAIAKFMLSELIDLLEVHKMKPFPGFSRNDVQTLKGLYATTTKMGIFFGDVIAMLKEDVGAKQRGKISVKDSGHQIQVWKDYPYIYAGNLFSVKWNNLNFWGWVGCYFSPNGPVLELHTGNNGKRPKWEVVDRVLKSNGFQYDEEEKDYDSYFRGLSSKLNVPSKGRNSAKGLAVEIGDILTKVLSKLQRVK